MQLFLMFCSSIILIYLGWGVFYQLIFSIAGRFWAEVELPPIGAYRKMVVLIPAYKEDKVICQSSLLEKNNATAHLKEVFSAVN